MVSVWTCIVLGHQRRSSQNTTIVRGREKYATATTFPADVLKQTVRTIMVMFLALSLMFSDTLCSSIHVPALALAGQFSVTLGTSASAQAVLEPEITSADLMSTLTVWIFMSQRWPLARTLHLSPVQKANGL